LGIIFSEDKKDEKVKHKCNWKTTEKWVSMRIMKLNWYCLLCSILCWICFRWMQGNGGFAILWSGQSDFVMKLFVCWSWGLRMDRKEEHGYNTTGPLWCLYYYCNCRCWYIADTFKCWIIATDITSILFSENHKTPKKLLYCNFIKKHRFKNIFPILWIILCSFL